MNTYGIVMNLIGYRNNSGPFENLPSARAAIHIERCIITCPNNVEQW